MKKRKGWGKRFINWIFGLFGYHIAQNPPKGKRITAVVNFPQPTVSGNDCAYHPSVLGGLGADE